MSIKARIFLGAILLAGATGLAAAAEQEAPLVVSGSCPVPERLQVVPEEGVPTATLEELLKLVRQGFCLEEAVARLITDKGPEAATDVVFTAYRILPQLSDYQEQCGCAGNIDGMAIAAGADPNDVLAATAAGLGGGAANADPTAVGSVKLDGGVGEVSRS